MRSLLSQEEIDALLNTSQYSQDNLYCRSIIEIEKKYIILKDACNLDHNSTIELDTELNRPYEIRDKEKLLAYGVVGILNGKLVLRITELIERHRCGVME